MKKELSEYKAKLQEAELKLKHMEGRIESLKNRIKELEESNKVTYFHPDRSNKNSIANNSIARSQFSVCTCRKCKTHPHIINRNNPN